MRTPDARFESRDGPGGFEWLLVYATLVGTAVVSTFAKGSQAIDPTASSTLGEVLWSILYVVAAVRLLTARDQTFDLLRRSAVLCAFVLVMVVSTLWSVNSASTFKNSLELVGTTLVACYLVVRYSLPRLLELFGAVFGTVGILSILVIVLAPSRGRMDWGSGAWSGVFQDKNNLAAAMALAIMTLLVSFAVSRGRRFLTGAILLLCFGLLLGSKSTTATLALMASCALGGAAYLWLSARPGGKLLLGAAAACVFFVFIIFGFQPDAIIGFLGKDTTLTGRTDFWPYITQAISERPILGYGYNAFFKSSFGTDALSYYVIQAGGWTPYHAHNSFLQISLDAGIVGLVAVILMMLVALMRAVRYLVVERTALALWPLLIVLYITLGSYTETYIGNYNTYEWLLLVAAILYPIRFAGHQAARARLSVVGAAPAPATIRGRG